MRPPLVEPVNHKQGVLKEHWFPLEAEGMQLATTVVDCLLWRCLKMGLTS